MSGLIPAGLTAMHGLGAFGIVLLALIAAVLFCPWNTPFRRAKTLLKLVLDRPRRERRTRRRRRSRR